MQSPPRPSLSSVSQAICALVLCAAAGSAAATALASSDACVDTPRTITVSSDVAATCLASGRGTTGGVNDAFRRDQDDWVALDNSDPTRTTRRPVTWLSGLLTGTQGSFSIDPAAWLAYDHLALGFQTGGSRSDPDWVVFQLADGTLDGLWAISAQNINHMVLYGINAPAPTLLAVAEPGSLALVGLACAGLWATRRRRQGVVSGD